MLRMLTGSRTEVRVSLCSEPVAANLAAPQTLAASPRLAHPGPRLPRCQTDPGPCVPRLFSWPLPFAQLAPGPPALDLPSIDFPFPPHTPLFFQPRRFISRFLDITLNYSLSASLSLARHLTAQYHTTGHEITQFQRLPASRPPLSDFACPSVSLLPDPTSTPILTTDAPTLETAGSHSPLALVSAPTTLPPLAADRQLSVLTQGAVPTPHWFSLSHQS